jgi:ferric-dicitrate binding protein FerR (iron transport regulator)
MSTPDARTASPSPLSPPALLADEAALKRIFDEEYTPSLHAAKAQLGEAASLAPRVVEIAFVNAWAQRDRLSSREQFRAVLDDEIRHGAARALSRRASGARFGAVGAAQAKSHDAATGQDSAEHVWAQIERALHGSGLSAEARAANATAGRHEAAAHLKQMSKRPGWIIPVAIGVVALVVSVAGVLYVDRLGEDDAVLTIVANQEIVPIQSGSGQIGSTKLGDGSQMTMGPETKVFIPDGFGTKNRAVKVEGTATFEVAPGQQMPFRVVARRQHFIATGTKFTVSTFTPDTIPMILVQEGSVTIKSGKNTAVATAGQAMVADAAKGIRPATDDEKAEVFGWVDKRVTVRNKQLRQVVSAMTRWFNYDIKVPDAPLLDRTASIDVPLDSSKLAITQVEQSAHLKFGYEGESKVFRDAPATAGAKPQARKK